MAVRIEIRSDTSANWASVNPVLGPGEAGRETDTGYIRYGDGVTAWSLLPTSDSQIATQVNTAGSQTQTAMDGRYAHVASGVFHVRDYGAKGDGTTDDTSAIHSALNAALNYVTSTSNHASVHLDSGTYLVHYAAQDLYPTYYAGIEVPTNVSLVGSGIGSTVIRLAAKQTQQGRIIANRVQDGGDTQITLSDFTIDGNGANQTVLGEGIAFTRATDIRVNRVEVTNVFGNAAAPPGETFHFSVDTCTRVMYTDCVAIGTSGTQGSGFSDNSSSTVSYTNCTAYGMSAGMGFTTWHGSGVIFTNCHAQKCGTHGFNAEYGTDIVYSGCIAGGQASDQAGGYNGIANSQTFGNSGSGFTVNATKNAVLSGCVARNNQTGASIVSSTPTGGSTVYSNVDILGGFYDSNTSGGIYFDTPTCAQGSNIASDVSVKNNTTFQCSINSTNGGVGYFDPTVLLAGHPATPSGTAVTNPYPFPVAVYIVSTNFYFGSIDGNSLGAAATHLHVPRGGTLQFNYGDTTTPATAWLRM